MRGLSKRISGLCGPGANVGKLTLNQRAVYDGPAGRIISDSYHIPDLGPPGKFLEDGAVLK